MIQDEDKKRVQELTELLNKYNYAIILPRGAYEYPRISRRLLRKNIDDKTRKRKC